MNNKRRKELQDIHNKLSEIKFSLEDLKNQIDTIKDIEQDEFDNMPEGLQGSEKGRAKEAAAEQMGDAYDSLDTVDGDLESALSSLDSAME